MYHNTTQSSLVKFEIGLDLWDTHFCLANNNAHGLAKELIYHIIYRLQLKKIKKLKILKALTIWFSTNKCNVITNNLFKSFVINPSNSFCSFDQFLQFLTYSSWRNPFLYQKKYENLRKLLRIIGSWSYFVEHQPPKIIALHSMGLGVYNIQISKFFFLGIS
jgi:hypothetical protein